jgi:hypothetical protein
MPGTLWSAPATTLNISSLTTSSFTTATLTDISPAPVVVVPPQLNVGTRVRLVAHGSYTASTTASTLTFGFYMAQVGQAITATGVVTLGAGPAVTAVAVTGIPWGLQYYGHIAALTDPVLGSTNGSIVGRGYMWYGTSLTAISWAPIPQTLAAVTVAQGATPGFGMVTNTAQLISVGVTIATNTGLTNVICDELTCELIG